MRIVQIPKKKKGEYRTIYVPNYEEKTALRALMGKLNQKVSRMCDESVVHGFAKKKSPVTNALAHVGHKYTLSFDLKDFFESVTPEKLAGRLSKEEAELVFVDGAARQGLPTSPAVANLAAINMDKAILALSGKHGEFIYTRYADDLTISFDDITLKDYILREVPKVVRRMGFKVNEKKTQFQDSRSGRRIVTGVAVDEASIYPTREAKRRLRAAKHQNNKNEINGLSEWCKLKTPKIRTVGETLTGDLDKLSKQWKLGIVAKHIPEKSPDEDLGENCIVTGDPVYMAGMSTFTTGWTSCVGFPNGQYRKGVKFWIYLPGARIAAHLSDKEKTIHGVTRKAMIARALVFELRDGRKAYHTIYPKNEQTLQLKAVLEKAGYVPFSSIERGERVKGHVLSAGKQPYTDGLKVIKVKLKNGKKARVIER